MRDPCFDCTTRPAAPGKWRCTECQARVDMRRATALLAGKPSPSKWARRLSPLDTYEAEQTERAPAGWLPYRD